MVRLQPDVLDEVIDLIETRFPTLVTGDLTQLALVFDPDMAEESLTFILPIRRLALYLIERFYYLPHVLELMEARTLIYRAINEEFPDERVIIIDEIDHYIDKAVKELEPSISISFNQLFQSFSIFFQFFLQLANPYRRYSELTYIFLFEYSRKLETLLKMEQRANYVITKDIDGTTYLQLVFDTLRQENLLRRLPVQFLNPKIAMVISDDPQIGDLSISHFNPELLFVVGKEFLSRTEGKPAYFIPFSSEDMGFMFEVVSPKTIYVDQIFY